MITKEQISLLLASDVGVYNAPKRIIFNYDNKYQRLAYTNAFKFYVGECTYFITRRKLQQNVFSFSFCSKLLPNAYRYDFWQDQWIPSPIKWPSECFLATLEDCIKLMEKILLNVQTTI